jgi:hypothetical protein
MRFITMNARTATTDPPIRVPLGRSAAVAIGLEILLGVGAIAGGLALMAGRHGEIIPLPLSLLAGSPFPDYLVPGAILFTILGLGPVGAAILAWRRHPAAPFLAFAVGGALLIWLAVQIATIGYSNDPPLQPVYLGLGVVITLVGVAWMRQSGIPLVGAVRRAARSDGAGTPRRVEEA